MMKVLVMCLAISVLAPSAAMSLERFPVVSTMELVTLLEDRAEGKTDFVLVNALDIIIAEDATIPGSINIPVHKMATTDLLPEDRSKFLVFY